jgi:sigma-B regulation protein RsbU (phosphoserine phosphatase)
MPGDVVLMETSNEWAAAREVQQGFMPSRSLVIDCLDYDARCRQVQALGGDFYDVMPLPGNRVAFAIGDASGKGLAAALMSANVQSSLRTAAWFAGGDGISALTAVNHQVHASSLDGRYATLFFGVFDPAVQTLRYVNAGHHPPMVIRRDGAIFWLETGGAPVGMFPDWPYEEGVVQLNPGDTILAYTDGVIEIENPRAEEWGIEGLRLAGVHSGIRCAADVVRAIFLGMDEFSCGCQIDDATVFAFRVQ